MRNSLYSNLCDLNFIFKLLPFCMQVLELSAVFVSFPLAVSSSWWTALAHMATMAVRED